MKLILFSVVVLSLAASSFAQQAEDASPSELTKLRENYLASLKLLLEQYTKENNQAAAASVTQEIAKVTAPAPSASPSGKAWFARIIKPAPALTPETSPIGKWLWDGGVATKTINDDGTAGDNHDEGVWRWLDRANRKFQINWKSGWIDKVTVSPDGKTMDVINNLDQEFTARRLPPENPNAAPASR